MATIAKEPGGPILIDLEPELQRRLKFLVGARGFSVSEYVTSVVRDVLSDENGNRAIDPGTWSRLSSRSFARDWDSDEDRAYETLA